MPSLWTDSEAQAAIERWGSSGAEFALRVYSARLIGRESSLVLHGGGNCSLKRLEQDLVGREREVLRIKGSGHDLASIGPEGFTAVDQGGLLLAGRRAAMTDLEMMEILRALQLDPSAPFPSVEAILHALIPVRYVDHTHADKLLVLSHQPDARRRLTDCLGPDFGILDYVMPGFELAQAARELFASSVPRCGLVLIKHGLFTWGESARESYERMIDAVERCAIAAAPTRAPAAAAELAARAETEAQRYSEPIKGALAGRGVRQIVVQRCDSRWRSATRVPQLQELADRGVLTPDHVIRTRPWAVVLPATAVDDEAQLREALARGIDSFEQRYSAYIDRHAAGAAVQVEDRLPHVFILPGVGLFCAGPSRREAEICADLATQTLQAKLDAEAIGSFTGLAESDLFAVEFWPPEQAKLKRLVRPPLAGRVALVSGAAGAIGSACAERLARAGAYVVLSDNSSAAGTERLAQLAARLTAPHLVHAADVTSARSVNALFDRAALEVGGIDLLVLAHGVAAVGELERLNDSDFERAMQVNAGGTLHLLAEFARRRRSCGGGGDVVLISTKNVAEPGAAFGAYSASKAAAHQLARIAALELAPLDVRVNAVAPDAVFGTAESPSLLWQEVGPARARSKGISPEELQHSYRDRNLLKAEIGAQHVAEAVLYFAERRSPTTGAVLPVDGGLPGAFLR